jgi:hypothetical protein
MEIEILGKEMENLRSLTTILLIQVFKENHQAEITTMLQN